MNSSQVARFYDYSETLRSKRQTISIATHSMHYGLWDSKTKTRDEALINTNEILSKLAKIKSGDRILDVGCGLRGSSVWLAKRFKTSVLGISLSLNEVESAKLLAQTYHVSTLSQFEVMDFTSTNLSTASFKVVWAVESTIYAAQKSTFLREMYRLLKKGGKVVIADLFLARKVIDTKDTNHLKTFMKGMIVPNIVSEKNFVQKLVDVGFSDIEIIDYTDQVLPTIVQSHRLSSISYPFSWISTKIGITDPILKKNMQAGISQKY